jgi:hypothetical protein
MLYLTVAALAAEPKASRAVKHSVLSERQVLGDMGDSSGWAAWRFARVCHGDEWPRAFSTWAQRKQKRAADGCALLWNEGAGFSAR